MVETKLDWTGQAGRNVFSGAADVSACCSACTARPAQYLTAARSERLCYETLSWPLQTRVTRTFAATTCDNCG